MASTSAAFPSKGSLKRTPFAKLMRAIGKAKATGSLYLLNGETKKVVFFAEGRPTFVRSNVLTECLGQILAHEGLITQQQCDQTLEAIRRTGKKQGELLVEMGILSAGNLRYGLETQLQRKLFEIFGWEDGRFQFKPGEPKQDPGLKLETSTTGLIVAALLEQDDTAAARAAFEGFADRYIQAKTKLLGELRLQPLDRHLFASLDGSRSAQEVLDAADGDRSDETLQLLYALVSAGAVSQLKEPAPASAPPSAPADHSQRADGEFKPDYAPSSELKPFEDTPLPGELPVRGAAEISDADADIDAAFANVASEDSGSMVHFESVRSMQSAVVDRALLDAEPDTLDEETFDEEIEVIEDVELEVIDDLDLEELDEVDEDSGGFDPDALAASDAAPVDPAALAVDEDLMMEADELLGLDELDDIDLGADLDAGAGPAPAAPAAPAATGDEDPEMLGAMRYGEGELALSAGNWAEAQQALEAAYSYGVDIAELHAMLAYARFKTDDTSADMAQHALELLDYAASMNPNLDMIYAFRGDVLLARGDHNGARASAEQALRLNEYNDIALSLMDRLS